MRRAVGTSGALGAVVAASIMLCLCAVPAAAGAQVLRVGTYHGIPGQFTSIQSAVNRAKPGDIILVAPGDYKTTAVHFPSGGDTFPTDILITTGGLTLRGMDRNAVMIDGTKAGSPLCSSAPQDQGYGVPFSSASSSAYGTERYGHAGSPTGRAADAPSGINGVMVFKAPNVTVENLSTCNFLGGAADAGNGVWWNGGADSGQVGGHGC